MHDTEAQIKFVKEPMKDGVLHLAARRRDNELMKLFIEAGAIVDSPNVWIFDFYFYKNCFINKITKMEFRLGLSNSFLLVF